MEETADGDGEETGDEDGGDWRWDEITAGSGPSLLIQPDQPDVAQGHQRSFCTPLTAWTGWRCPLVAFHRTRVSLGN